MILSDKRARKAPVLFEIVYTSKKTKLENNSNGMPRIIRCDYEIMPAPVKYGDAGEILLLYGVPLSILCIF